MKNVQITIFILILALTFSSCIFIKGFTPDQNLYLSETRLSGKGMNKIGVIDITGLISDRKKASILGVKIGENTLYSVTAQLEKIRQDKSVKAIIFKLDSPGGMVTASDIIYREIIKLKKERQIPVVACLMDVAASGAYYIAMSADKIVAHPTTVTGSIGVIMQNFSFTGLIDKIGVEDRSITSGKNKDLGSPFKPMTREQRQILQAVVNDLHTQFVEVVKEGRPDLTEKQIRTLADGRIFTAQQALGAGLIDQIGYFEDAVELAKKEAQIKTAKVILYHERSLIPQNVYATAQTPVKAKTPVNIDVDIDIVKGIGEPKFLYLWVP